jgi:hypothetical protein
MLTMLLGSRRGLAIALVELWLSLSCTGFVDTDLINRHHWHGRIDFSRTLQRPMNEVEYVDSRDHNYGTTVSATMSVQWSYSDDHVAWNKRSHGILC